MISYFHKKKLFLFKIVINFIDAKFSINITEYSVDNWLLKMLTSF